MENLKFGDHLHLTDNVKKILSQNRITTILEFLQEDTEKLCALTKLSLPQILDVRDDILKQYSAPVLNSALLLRSCSKRFLTTGIKSLDAVTGGGLPIGYITEICGLANTGKTQLCFQLTINCVKNTDSKVLYVDTKGDFSAIRIQKVLDACGYTHKEMALIMFKIRVVHIWTMEQIVELFEKLKHKLLKFDNLSLIIIDSLPCLMFQHLGDDNKIGLTLLNTLVNYSRLLCKEINLAIVCVNIQTRWVDQDVADVEDNADECGSAAKETYIETRNRCLGKYWQRIPNLVLLLEKSQGESSCEGTQLNVTAVKFNVKCEQKCILNISGKGVT